MSIEERVEALEREARHNRKMVRWLVVFLGLCIGAWLVTGVFFPQGLVAQDVIDEIRARRFMVVDERGEPYVWLGMLDRPNPGRPALLMFDERGYSLISLVVSEGAPMLGMYGERGYPLIRMGVFEGEPGLAMHDEGGNTRIAMGVAEGAPSLTMLDERGNTRICMVVFEGEPMLEMGDEKGYVIWQAP